MPDAYVAVEAGGCDVLVAGVECCGNDAEFVSLGEGEGLVFCGLGLWDCGVITAMECFFCISPLLMLNIVA